MKKLIQFTKENGTSIKIVSSDFLSSLGTGITLLAIPLAMIEMEGGSMWFAMATLSASILLFFLSPMIGKAIDRYPKKHIILCNTFCLSFLVFMVSLSIENTDFYLIQLSLLQIVSTGYYAVQTPTRLKFVYDSLKPEKFEKINRILEVQAQATSVLGGVLGAVILSVFDIATVLKFDSITYLIAFLSYLSIRSSLPENQERDTDESLAHAPAKTKFEAMAFLRNHPISFFFPASDVSSVHWRDDWKLFVACPHPGHHGPGGRGLGH